MHVSLYLSICSCSYVAIHSKTCFVLLICKDHLTTVQSSNCFKTLHNLIWCIFSQLSHSTILCGLASQNHSYQSFRENLTLIFHLCLFILLSWSERSSIFSFFCENKDLYVKKNLNGTCSILLLFHCFLSFYFIFLPVFLFAFHFSPNISTNKYW